MTEVTDAYQEYVRMRREEKPVQKLVHIELPLEDAVAIHRIIASAVDKSVGLPASDKRHWDSILNTIAGAAHEVV